MKQLPSLSGFRGTGGYTYLNFLRNLKFTDGWVYLAEQVGCYWLADIVASVQHLPKIQEYQHFIVWRIVVENEQAVVSAYSDSEEDGTFSDNKLLYKQEIAYTDFPKGTFEWYQEGDVVLLKGEH
tara:strand:- start:4177 stop:4551 length:375 start_codon:yes stop_codon:yes gene_type:complete